MDGVTIKERIYHHISLHSQANARWSYVDPPLATLPPDLRCLYIPDEGWPWFGWDYDQQELRIIAALSEDKPLLDTFANGWDIHTLNTCDIFGFPYPTNRANPHTSPEDEAWRAAINWEGKEDERRVFAKRFVYRLNYGGDPKTMGTMPGAKALGLTGPKMTVLANAYLAAHPQLNAWRQRVIEDATRTGETRTFMGRRRRYMATGASRARQALDHPMQAAGQDIANTVVVQIKERCGDAVYYVYGMHDSQNWAIRYEAWKEVVPTIMAIVTQPWQMGRVEMAVPATWKVTCDRCGYSGKPGCECGRV